MVIYQVVSEADQFTALDSQCHVLSINPWTYKSYVGTMQDRLWPLKIKGTTPQGNLLLERYPDSYLMTVVVLSFGYDCNGHSVGIMIAMRTDYSSVRYMLVRHAGYAPHVASQHYLLPAAALADL